VPINLKELIVILVIAAAVFRLARPVALAFSTAEDYARRRNAWYALTAAAFICPSFWLYAVIALPILVIVGRRDPNPGAVYLLLLQVIPPIPISIPMVGLSRLFNIDHYLLLSICVMIPAALRLRRSKDRAGIRGLEWMDFFLLAYGLLSAVLYLHPEVARGVLNRSTVTDDVRRAFVFFVGVYIPYFVISRSASSRRLLLEDMASFCLACALMAAIAIFEGMRQWLLFGELPSRWGYVVSFSLYYLRSGTVRAMASAGHPLTLGFVLGIALGFWYCLQSRVFSARYRIGVTILLLLGLIATYSRGPWLGAALIFFVFNFLRPRAMSALMKAGGGALIVAIVISFTPIGDKIADLLPSFSTSSADESIIYRHRLLDRALEIIQQNPLFGDQYAVLKMQDLRQGEGIIDIINTYVQVVLASGLVGLGLFLSVILIGLFNALAWTKRTYGTDPDFGAAGASLVACIVGTLVMLFNGSFGGAVERLFYTLAALAAAYAYLGRMRQQGMLDPALRKGSSRTFA
jgi:hypothetical protein